MPKTLLQEWSAQSIKPDCSIVLPDGCRDLIVNCVPNNAPQWFVSDLSNQAYPVHAVCSEVFHGYRLYPGVYIAQDKLLTAIKYKKDITQTDIYNLLDDFTVLSVDVAEALAFLAEDHLNSITFIANQLGVSERSLERLLTKHTKRSPIYWKSLARVRKAARATLNTVPLIQIAHEYGYTDQAHMSRDFKRWFGVNPTQFRSNKQVHKHIHDSGYG
ncbi:helix-turn-helix domain-containing protein [Neisseria sp. Ec49-e6-T10]|uniref:helix-turn-helix domain-containing protein n=1 Tax=Neisseria sp. Ec49-e6-T10 TaxID=3140744 RepID=UPI003EB8CE6D